MNVANSETGRVIASIARIAPNTCKYRVDNRHFAKNNLQHIKQSVFFWIFSTRTQAASTQTLKSNAAILSLLNSAPAAMTSSAVVGTLNTATLSPARNQAQPTVVRCAVSTIASQLALSPALMTNSSTRYKLISVRPQHPIISPHQQAIVSSATSNTRQKAAGNRYVHSALCWPH